MSSKDLYQWLPPACAAVVGVLASIGVFWLINSAEREETIARFESAAKDKIHAVELEIAANLDVLTTIRSFYKSSPDIRRDQFRSFTKTFLDRHANIQALEWIPRVPSEQRAAYERAARADGLKDFSITEREAQGVMVPVMRRAEYFPVYYVEPIVPNKAAIGFDLASNPRRLAALNRARDSGQQVATSRITLVQEKGSQAGILIFDPIYQIGKQPTTTEERRQLLMGFALSVVRVGDMIGKATRSFNSDLFLQLVDVTNPGRKEPLYGMEEENVTSDLWFERTIDIAGRRWQIKIAPESGHYLTGINANAWAVLGLGIFLSVTLALYLLLILNTRSKIKQRVQKQTLALRQSDEKLRRINSEQKVLLDQLKQSNSDLEQFAIIASHDLQEPLRKVQAFADRLHMKYSDELGEDGKDYLNRMRNAAQRMESLIKDLLSYARVSSKTKPFTPVDLGEIVRQVADDLEFQIDESDAKLDIGQLPVINGDCIQIRQLFQNLIGNALKYRREETPPVIRIGAKLEPVQNGSARNNHDWVHNITISDNGIGFDGKYAERVFGIFQRLHGRDAYSGTGVGLAICRKIVTQHNGKIAARGVPDEGATFCLTLPYAEASKEQTQNGGIDRNFDSYS